MAALNGTQANVAPVAKAFAFTGSIPVQLEKISCWQGRLFQTNPFLFFGKRIRVGELTQGCYGDDRGFADESIVYEAKVLAVHVGSVEDGIETTLLLKQDGYDPDYVNVSKLTVLELLE